MRTASISGRSLSSFGSAQPFALFTGDPDAVFDALEQHEVIVQEVVAAQKTPAHADRTACWGYVERELLLNLVHQVERIPAFAIQFVHEGDNRHIAQPTDFEQLECLLLDTACSVDHHDRAVDGGQRAIGIFAEVLMARCVQQVERVVAVVEGHRRGAHGDTALTLHLHPVRARAPLLTTRLDRSGQLDRSAEQKQLLRERGFAGVGMGNDGERAPAFDRLGE